MKDFLKIALLDPMAPLLLAVVITCCLVVAL